MTVLGSEIHEREDDLCNNDAMDAARVRGRALQRGRHTRAAMKTTRVAMKAAMVGTGGARDGRDGRR